MAGATWLGVSLSKGFKGLIDTGGREEKNGFDGSTVAVTEEPGENQAGGPWVLEMDGAGVAGVISISKGFNSNKLALAEGRGGAARRMLEDELEWLSGGGVVPVGLRVGVVVVTVADFGRPAA